MEFNEKLQELRKQRGMTQEELAEALYVSRAAVSKWESGRGYPGIDSLKAISKLFSITIDELLSRDELLTIAEEDNREKQKNLRDLVFGLLDCCYIMLLFLPFFAQRGGGEIQEVSLLSLTEATVYMRAAYFAIISAITLFGVMTLSLQNCKKKFWLKFKGLISLLLNTIGALIFIISLHPYAAIFLFVFLVIKALILIKWH